MCSAPLATDPARTRYTNFGTPGTNRERMIRGREPPRGRIDVEDEDIIRMLIGGEKKSPRGVMLFGIG